MLSRASGFLGRAQNSYELTDEMVAAALEEEKSVPCITYREFVEMVQIFPFYNAVYEPLPQRQWSVYKRDNGKAVLARTVRWTFTNMNGTTIQCDLFIITGVSIDEKNPRGIRKAKREAHTEYRIQCIALRHIAYIGGDESLMDNSFRGIIRGLKEEGELIVTKFGGLDDLQPFVHTISRLGETKDNISTAITDPVDFFTFKHQWPAVRALWDHEADQEIVVAGETPLTDDPEEQQELQARIIRQANLFKSLDNPALHWPSKNEGLTEEVKKIRIHNIKLIYLYEGLWYLVLQLESMKRRGGILSPQEIQNAHPHFNTYRLRYLNAKELSQVPLSNVAALVDLHEQHAKLKYLAELPLHKKHDSISKEYDKVKHDPKKLPKWRTKNASFIKTLLDPSFGTMKEQLGSKWDPHHHPLHKALEEKIADQRFYMAMLGPA